MFPGVDHCTDFIVPEEKRLAVNYFVPQQVTLFFVYNFFFLMYPKIVSKQI